MRRRIGADLDVDRDVVFAALEDLDEYGTWLDLITRVDRAEPVPADPGPAWWVTLRARVGPLARSKRLRMVRAVHDRPHHLQFMRHEIDGREHSPWTLEVHITADPLTAASVVEVELSYEGSLWSPILDAVLGPQLDQAVPRLRERLAAQ